MDFCFVFMDALTTLRLWFPSPLSHCKSGVTLLEPLALTGIESRANQTGAWHWASVQYSAKAWWKSTWCKYCLWTENTSSIKTRISLVHFFMVNRGLSSPWVTRVNSLWPLFCNTALSSSSPSLPTFKPYHPPLRPPMSALDEVPYEGKKPENTCQRRGLFSLWQWDERLMTVTWWPYLHASCSRAGEVLIWLHLGALVVHEISSAAHCRFTCGFILLQARLVGLFLFFQKRQN